MTSFPFSAVITTLDVLIQFAYCMGVMVVGGLVISDIPLPITLEKFFLNDCPSGRFEYDMTIWFASISIICVIFSVPMMMWAKMDLAILFQDEVDARRREQTADTSVIKWIIFSAHVMLVACSASTVLLIFYMIQVKSIKFNCMDISAQVVLIGFMFAFAFAISLLMVGAYDRTKKTFEQIDS